MIAAPRRATGLHGDVVLGGAALAMCAGLALDPDTVDGGPVVCPFRLATGHPCPACGSIRAWTAALHGRWVDAAASNPFALLLLVALVVALAWRVASIVARRPGSPDLDRLVRSHMVLAVFAAWLAWWAAGLVA